jgi:hypothetical protein
VADIVAFNMQASGGASYRRRDLICCWELPVPVYLDASLPGAAAGASSTGRCPTTGPSRVSSSTSRAAEPTACGPAKTHSRSSLRDGAKNVHLEGPGGRSGVNALGE